MAADLQVILQVYCLDSEGFLAGGYYYNFLSLSHCSIVMKRDPMTKAALTEASISLWGFCLVSGAKSTVIMVGSMAAGQHGVGEATEDYILI